MRVTVKAILREIGCPHLDLVQGKGYWYFVYDDKAKHFHTYSIATMRLSAMTLDEWVKEGREWVQILEAN